MERMRQFVYALLQCNVSHVGRIIPNESAERFCIACDHTRRAGTKLDILNGPTTRGLLKFPLIYNFNDVSSLHQFILQFDASFAEQGKTILQPPPMDTWIGISIAFTFSNV